MDKRLKKINMCECLSHLLGRAVPRHVDDAVDAPGTSGSAKYAAVQKDGSKAGVESSPLLSSRRRSLSLDGETASWTGHDTFRIKGLKEPGKMIEDQINQYRIAGMIGKGSWGIVQAAEDVYTGQKVAIKAVGKQGLRALVSLRVAQ